MASVFLYHVVGDLTVGKPELVEFAETETVESAIRVIGEWSEGGIPVWKKRLQKSPVESAESRQQRFLGILNSMDIAAYLGREENLMDQEKAMKTPVAEVLVPNTCLLKEVDPGTRLIDALDMMKQGVRRLLVPKSVAWKGMSKRFSILYNGKWLRNLENSGSPVNGSSSNSNWPSPSTHHDKFCCLSREDVIRFVIGCLGALAPIPLSSISSLGAINPHYFHIDASAPAIEAIQKRTQDPCAVAIIDTTPTGRHKIIGEISACRLWKCDYLEIAWALANLSAGQFATGVEDSRNPVSFPDLSVSLQFEGGGGGGGSRPQKFSSRSIGFFNNPMSPTVGGVRNMYRGRRAPLTCKVTSSLAAVMAQMLSHRATYVWVTEDESEDTVVGMVSYTDILVAVTKHPFTVVAPPP